MGMRLAASSATPFRLQQNSEINVTPFVDIMLVLLIIFMVSIPPVTTAVKVDLPPAPAGARPQAPPTYVSLQSDGRVFVGDQPTSLSTLPADLAAAIGGSNPRNERVYVRADMTVRYEAFMAVINRLKATGYARVGLVGEEI
ncbi:biopolymer transporter ExbD [Phenylobacterium sp.]|uniref:biopolymer transporter ExbD n=1 Tax=Phenylobacterium sp. TaxID=1871053 RepID=UPI0035AD8958